jgi:hypothetical protein
MMFVDGALATLLQFPPLSYSTTNCGYATTPLDVTVEILHSGDNTGSPEVAASIFILLSTPDPRKRAAGERHTGTCMTKCWYR